MTPVDLLRAEDCALLKPDSDSSEADGARLIQRLLETAISTPPDSVATAMLREICDVLGAEHVSIHEARPGWPCLAEHGTPGRRGKTAIPHDLLGEVADRRCGRLRFPEGKRPAYIAAVLGGDEPVRVLLACRQQPAFTAEELEYAVAAAHFVGLAVARAAEYQAVSKKAARSDELIQTALRVIEQRDTVSLLEHIAAQAVRLVDCERASIFLWDRERGELVGRPALGLPNGELRIPDDRGVVGQVVHSASVIQVDDVRASSLWDHRVDDASGFQTRSLLCVPLIDLDDTCLGAIQVLNKRVGRFDDDDRITLELLGRFTLAALENVREYEVLLRGSLEHQQQAMGGCQIVGECPEIQQLRNTLKGLAPTNLPVLVLGESGTGKDVVARALHYASPRAKGPFVPVNCAAIAETLLESELFGHEKGAFTGADQQRSGKFEAANGGTLFLDEVGDLSPGGQAKLLRVLEEKVVYRVGGTHPIPVDVRIVAATNKDLAQAVKQKKFREDLYYRLSVVAIKLPPLRERGDDVQLLADHFLREFCRQAGRKRLKFSAEAKKRLRHHSWPGNVRELRNLIERVAYLCPHDRVEPQDLAFIAKPEHDYPDELSQLPLAAATEAFQTEHIKKAIERAGGNISDAAKLLGLHRPNLYRKMRLLGIKLHE